MAIDISRKDIDDLGCRNNNQDSYKNRHFKGRKIALDEYTGLNLFYSSKGKFTTRKTANIDHVIPLAKIKQRYSNSLGIDEIKAIANADYNLAATSEHLNKSKGDLSNHEVLLRDLRKGKVHNPKVALNMLRKEFVAEVATTTHSFSKKTVNKFGGALRVNKKTLNRVSNNVGKRSASAISSGVDAALMAGTVSGINNLVLVARGEKSIAEASRDVAQKTGGALVTTVGVNLSEQAFEHIAKTVSKTVSKTPLLKALPVAQVVNVVMVGNSVVQYIDGNITAEECATEILMDSVGVVAFALGSAVAGPVGAFVASVVMGKICGAILEYKQANKMAAEKLSRVNHIATEALSVMEFQRNILKEMVDEEFRYWDEQIDQGFEEIAQAILTDNADRVVQGLDKIASIFGGEVKFKTQKEFDDFFNDKGAAFKF